MSIYMVLQKNISIGAIWTYDFTYYFNNIPAMLYYFKIFKMLLHFFSENSILPGISRCNFAA